FFQAEDGIRDFHVTGVQTCALPISHADGNTHRVIRLSNQTVANRLTCTFGYSATSEPIDATRTKVIVTETGGSNSRSYEFTVLSQPGGKPGAVSSVVADCT